MIWTRTKWFGHDQNNLEKKNWTVQNQFDDTLISIKFLDWLKKFGPPQNILGPVKGQGI